jgi:hypothetical protein
MFFLDLKHISHITTFNLAAKQSLICPYMTYMVKSFITVKF